MKTYLESQNYTYFTRVNDINNVNKDNIYEDDVNNDENNNIINKGTWNRRITRISHESLTNDINNVNKADNDNTNNKEDDKHNNVRLRLRRLQPLVISGNQRHQVPLLKRGERK